MSRQRDTTLRRAIFLLLEANLFALGRGLEFQRIARLSTIVSKYEFTGENKPAPLRSVEVARH